MPMSYQSTAIKMSFSAIVTIFVICMVMYTSAFTRLKSDVIFIAALFILMATGVLNLDQSFGSLVSEGVLSLAFLTIIVAAVRRTGGMRLVTKIVCGQKDTTLGRLLLRVTSAASAVSMFVSNTVVATVFFADVAKWARDHKINPSKVILPTDYALTIAGLCTIIGASGNLLTLDIFHEMTGKTIHLFAPMPLALPCLLVCLLLILLLRRFAPDRPNAPKNCTSVQQKVVVEMLVPSDNYLIGKTFEEIAELKNEGVRLVKLCRFDDEIISPITASEYVMGGDRLVLYGDYSKLLDLRIQLGLVSSRDLVYNSKEITHRKRLLQSAIVAPNSSLVGCCITDSNFEKKNGVTLLALMRDGEELNESPRHITLKSGDLLTFEGAAFQWQNLHQDLQPYGETMEVEQGNKKWIAMSALLLVIVGSAVGLFPLSLGSCGAVLLLGTTGCISYKMAWSNVPWGNLTMIAGSKAIGTAITVSGIAGVAADLIHKMCGGEGVMLPLAILVAISIVLTQLVTATAVIALLVPIGITFAGNVGIDPLPVTLAILFGSSFTFLSHFTAGHMAMAMPHGNYRMKDLLLYGWPFTLAMYATTLFFFWLIYLE